MSKRKGVSLVEKRQRLMKIFYDDKSIYTLKELEKLGAKVGVISQTVKDVLQGLIDDNLVDQDKIGASNIYWAFPSKALVVRNTKIDQLKTKIKADEDTQAGLLKRKADLLTDREPTEKRQKLLNDFDSMTKQEKEIDERLKTYRKNDPVVIKEMETAIVTCVEAINRWTDNAYNCKSYMVKKLYTIPKDTDKLLGITDDFDYVEMPKPIVTELPKALEPTNPTPQPPSNEAQIEDSSNNHEGEEDIDNQPILKEKGSPMGIPIEITS